MARSLSPDIAGDDIEDDLLPPKALTAEDYKIKPNKDFFAKSRMHKTLLEADVEQFLFEERDKV